MAFLIKSRKTDLIQLARDLDESPDPSMSKIVLRDLIISSKYYKEEEAKELLEVITAERRDCPKNRGVDNKRLTVNKVSTEGTELEDGTVAARVDLLGKVIPRQAIEGKLSKLVKTSISVDGKLVHALVDSSKEITVVKKDLVPGISVEGASTIYLKEVLVEDVLLPPDVLDMLGGARSEENSLAQKIN
ncbi:CCHC-type domain-containing protein [Nephila pilipes]|uniref:CCHC-type domain-containing protein n=1 Tax=Nephila pilipes TaxID=299642 RepID=A0A8X6I665_NEPPI|nr:CCHC-type domain-containing protein [Nephila pilipes]